MVAKHVYSIYDTHEKSFVDVISLRWETLRTARNALKLLDKCVPGRFEVRMVENSARLVVEGYLSNLSDNDKMDLHFVDKIEFKRGSTVADLVEAMIQVMLVYPSFRIYPDKWTARDTRPGANRSALDIWRHARVFDPSITIYQVMEALYSLTHKLGKNIGTMKCSTIHKRVFFKTTYGRELSVYSEDHLDEFGLRFDDWKDIAHGG